MATLQLREWNSLVSLACTTHLLPRLSLQAGALGLLDGMPEEVRPHLESARLLAKAHDRELRWEVNRVQRALSAVDTPVVLLKGAAYALSGSDAAKGRLCSDLDFLVPKKMLAKVEQALLEHGWVVAEESAHKEQYTRRWLHELPPLIHSRRQTTLDVHHNILPYTDNLRVDAAKLLDAAVPLEANPRFAVLSPADTVLHSATHMFRGGRFASGLRNLVDLDDLLRQFGSDDLFWSGLVNRASELGLTIPCYFALRYTGRFLKTPIPNDTQAVARRWKPRWPPATLMDWLVERAMLPRTIDRPDRFREIAILFLSRYPLSLFRRTIIPKLERVVLPRPPAG